VCSFVCMFWGATIWVVEKKKNKMEIIDWDERVKDQHESSKMHLLDASVE
jgi:hypothetical protein